MVAISDALAAARDHHQAGDLRAAERLCRQILLADENQPDALHLLGIVVGQSGRTQDGAALIRRAITLVPGNAQLHNNLGNVLRAAGNLDEAVACYRRALEFEPDCAAIHDNLGNALEDQGKLVEAADSFRRALSLSPGAADIHCHLGNALKDQGELDAAVACYRRALQLQPDSAAALCNLGHALTDRGELDEAVACCRRAIELTPDMAEAHNNLGMALRELGRFVEALVCYRRALMFKPGFVAAHWNQSLVWLLQGDFERGWREYEWRWRRRRSLARPFSQPEWDGDSLVGKTILLHAEQGLGDTLQFIRYAPLVKERGAIVIVECQPPLVPLLGRTPGIDRLFAAGDNASGQALRFDVHAPLVSLPRILQTTPATIPADVLYLHADPALVERWRGELGPIREFKIGIAWQGSPQYGADRLRSIPLRHFEPLARVPGVRLFSLQKGIGTEQLRGVAGLFPLTELDGLDTTAGAFMDTAAVMKNLDLVITSDTAIAHLAGALGVPVWVALPLTPDWRWLLERTDSPWYPTMRLFRQRIVGDWPGVFAELHTALREKVAARDAAVRANPFAADS